jgi:drug/metabolite transporter (DMT)-like permease
VSAPAHDARRGIAWAFFASSMAASFLIPWKVATRHGEPRLAVLCLLTVAALLNTVGALATARRGRPAAPGHSWRVTWILACAFALLTLLGNWASAEAVARVSGALLAVAQRSEVILVGILGALFLGERVRAPFWLGAALSGVGLWILQRPGSAADGDFDPVGVLYGLGSAACFGGMVVLSRRYVTRIRLLPFNALRLWLSVLLWFVVEGRVPDAAELPPELIASAGLAGFFGPFLSRLGALQSAHHVPAQMTSVVSLATPVITLGLAFLVLGNLPTTRELLGGSIMLAGIAVPVLAALRRP